MELDIAISRMMELIRLLEYIFETLGVWIMGAIAWIVYLTFVANFHLCHVEIDLYQLIKWFLCKTAFRVTPQTLHWYPISSIRQDQTYIIICVYVYLCPPLLSLMRGKRRKQTAWGLPATAHIEWATSTKLQTSKGCSSGRLILISHWYSYSAPQGMSKQDIAVGGMEGWGTCL